MGLDHPARPFVIGVTGNIACGKSAVLEILRELGVESLDADHLYHELIVPGSPLTAAIRARFPDAVSPDGVVDRRALAVIVFADAHALADLDAITHPVIAHAARDRISRSDARVLAIDAVKLIESGMYRDCDQVWLVECMPETQVERLMARNGLSRDEAIRRIAVQPPAEAKRAIASVILNNDGAPQELRRQVRAAWSNLAILPS